MKHKININILISLLVITASSCTNNISQHGIIIKEENLKKVRVGKTKQNVTIALLGPPSLETNRYGNKILYYMNYQISKKPLQKPQMAEYGILELVFKNNRLIELNKSTLADFQKITINPDQTPYKQQKQSIFKQLLKNIGRFDDSGDI